MRRSIFLTIFILCAGCLLASAQRQTARTASSDALRKLLTFPAPTPRVKDESQKQNAKQPRPPDFYSNMPPDDDDDDKSARAERWRREVAREKARFSWRKFDGGALGEVTDQPPGYSSFDESSFEIERDDFNIYSNNQLAQ